MSGIMPRSAVFAGLASLSALAVLAAAAAGYRLGSGKWPGWDFWRPGAEQPERAAAGPEPAEKPRKILYYRNPMGLADTSPVPKKDWMGMDYIPVYEGEEPDDSAAVTVSAGKIQRAGVRTERAELRRLAEPVRAPGTVKFDERTLHAVTLRADAFIEKLYVEETGVHVKAGQPLFRIYSPAMVSAQVDYRIALPDRDVRGRSPQGLTGAGQKLRNLEIPEAVVSRLNRTGEPVMSIDWPSPADGVIMKKNAVDGQMVRMGEEIFRIAGLDKVWVIADVAEQDVGRLAVGQPAAVRFKAFPSETFRGAVTFILHELEMATRTAKVRIELANPGHRIKHEMFAEVEIDAAAGSAPRVAVPRSAVIDSGRRQVVLVERGEGRFEPREVETGVRGDGYIEVRKGIAAGEKVVVAGNFLIDSESNLKAALAGFAAASSGPETQQPSEHHAAPPQEAARQ